MIGEEGEMTRFLLMHPGCAGRAVPPQTPNEEEMLADAALSPTLLGNGLGDARAGGV